MAGPPPTSPAGFFAPCCEGHAHEGHEGVEECLYFWASIKMPSYAVEHTTFLHRSSILEEDSFHGAHVGITDSGHLVE